MAAETQVLCLYVGGTIGMIKHPLHGYQPHASFLTETLRTQARFHDPFGSTIFSWSDSIDRYQQWSGVHSASGSRSASPTRSSSTDAALVKEIQMGIAHQQPLPSPGFVKEQERFTRDPNLRRATELPTKIWPPFSHPLTVRASSAKGVSTVNATQVKVRKEGGAGSNHKDQEDMIEMQLPSLLTPTGQSGKRVRYCVLEYDPLLDSSEMTYSDWKRLSRDIALNYANFDSFIVLHGTDTMAYTASALSMLLENLGKSVIVTGAQVPLSELRNDAIENVLGALMIAGAYIIPEVTLYFASKLYRGNRTSKISNDALAAFDSPNMAPLAHVGIDIDVHWGLVQRPKELRSFEAHADFCEDVAILRLFPGLPLSLVRAVLAAPRKGVVLETFGAGNAASSLLDAFREASQAGVVIVNITQCLQGTVSSIYAAGKKLEEAGVVSGGDMTPECALIKLAYLLGKQDLSTQDVRNLIGRSLRGEITATSPVAVSAASAAAAADGDDSCPTDDAGSQSVPQLQELVSDILFHTSTTSVGMAKTQTMQNAQKSTASWTVTAQEIQRADRIILPLLIRQAVQVGDVDALAHHLDKFDRFATRSFSTTAAAAGAGARTDDTSPSATDDVLNINILDDQQPLHLAAARGRADMVALLLAAGASVHLRDQYGFTPLFAALRNGHLEAAQLIKKTGGHLRAQERAWLQSNGMLSLTFE